MYEENDKKGRVFFSLEELPIGVTFNLDRVPLAISRTDLLKWSTIFVVSITLYSFQIGTETFALSNLREIVNRAQAALEVELKRREEEILRFLFTALIGKRLSTKSSSRSMDTVYIRRFEVLFIKVLFVYVEQDLPADLQSEVIKSGISKDMIPKVSHWCVVNTLIFEALKGASKRNQIYNKTKIQIARTKESRKNRRGTCVQENTSSRRCVLSVTASPECTLRKFCGRRSKRCKTLQKCRIYWQRVVLRIIWFIDCSIEDLVRCSLLWSCQRRCR